MIFSLSIHLLAVDVEELTRLTEEEIDKVALGRAKTYDSFSVMESQGDVNRVLKLPYYYKDGTKAGYCIIVTFEGTEFTWESLMDDIEDYVYKNYGEGYYYIYKYMGKWNEKYLNKAISFTLPIYKEIYPYELISGPGLSNKLRQYWRAVYGIIDVFGLDCQFQYKYPIIVHRGGATYWAFEIEGVDYVVESYIVGSHSQVNLINLEETSLDEYEKGINLEDEYEQSINNSEEINKIWNSWFMSKFDVPPPTHDISLIVPDYYPWEYYSNPSVMCGEIALSDLLGYDDFENINYFFTELDTGGHHTDDEGPDDEPLPWIWDYDDEEFDAQYGGCPYSGYKNDKFGWQFQDWLYREAEYNIWHGYDGGLGLEKMKELAIKL